MKYLLEEQETIIRWDRKYPEANIYTFEPSLKRKLKEMEHQFPDMIELEREDKDFVEYIVPKELISIRKPRVISDEAKEKMRQNITKARQSKRPEDDGLQTQLQAF